MSAAENLDTNLKDCPYCSEQIIASAKKCKHCGEFLDKELREANRPKEAIKSTGAAAVLSFIIPGLGHLYCGYIFQGIIMFVLTIAGYTIIIPGVIMHLLTIMSAMSAAEKINREA